jgi:hypothetical protein
VETLGYAASFSSPWRGKRRVLVRRKPLLTDQLQPSTNSDKLSDTDLDALIFQHHIAVGDCLDQHNVVAHTDPKRIGNAGVIDEIQCESDQSWQAKASDAL